MPGIDQLIPLPGETVEVVFGAVVTGPPANQTVQEVSLTGEYVRRNPEGIVVLLVGGATHYVKDYWYFKKV